MGRHGPAPKPTRIKKITGNPGKRRMNPKEPDPDLPAGLPKPPTHFNAAAKKEWTRAGSVLLDSRILTKADIAVLEAYCRLYGRWDEAERKLRRQGMIILVGKDKKNKYQQINPLLTIATQCIRQMRLYLAELGMTPSSRSRISAEERPIEPEESAEEFFSGPQLHPESKTRH